jgi:hypothetical protein
MSNKAGVKLMVAEGPMKGKMSERKERRAKGEIHSVNWKS